jgi:hypothetical protein
MKSAQSSRLGELASEVTRKGYLGRAQQRAARRKSPWNLLDILFGLVCMGASWWAFVHSVWAVRNLVIPQHAVSFSAFFHSHPSGSLQSSFLLPRCSRPSPSVYSSPTVLFGASLHIVVHPNEKPKAFGTLHLQTHRKTYHYWRYAWPCPL